MKIITITKGLPGSGKTTYVNELLKKHPARYKNICKDDLRKMFDNSHWSKGNEKFILNVRDLLILTSLAQGYHVIISDTNLHPKHEKHIRELVRGKNVQVKIVEFNSTPEECIERDLKRPNSVGSKIIWKMYNDYLKPKEEGQNKPEVLKQDSNLPHAIIVDLDGTVCIHNGRSPYEWEKCDTDLPNIPVIELIETYLATKSQVIFLSGRDGRALDKTLKWLKNNIRLYDRGWDLFMREPKDTRKDCIIKRELFDKHIKDKYYVDFVLDDRNQVVKLWRSMGLTCLQVAEGNF